MSSILVNKNIDILIMFGNGRKVGDRKQWLLKEQVELVELLTVIVIDCIRLHYMQI